MKHVKQLLSALLYWLLFSLLPPGVLKASCAGAPAALNIGYPFKNTELLDEVYDLSSSAYPNRKDL